MSNPISNQNRVLRNADSLLLLIATVVILFLALLLGPILLIRFRKRWVAAFSLAVTNRNYEPIRQSHLFNTEHLL